ncbi:phosphate ABC transporter permease PstA [Nocardioides jiangxiensis]|uniref:Phosphate transport system permease protein PstA n=1 Tax=Nocardioides jiangxiensis TaxID=3064524 RepID=A0ABT9B0M8_9ACTN|nr:phosphate ABC transporter permease PstA [Nocardioides sp. WY-20]MDO7867869.1 phosphate ABC transporter permease PstA [Nocardioides sp. WY-20]
MNVVDAPLASSELTSGRLPRFAPVIAGVVALGIGVLLGEVIIGGGLAGTAVFSGLAYLVLLPLWYLAVEGRRAAVDRLVTSLVWGTLLVALVPLVSLLYTVVRHGAPQINGTFLGQDAFILALHQPTGILHAIVGTLVITVAAALMSVPLGIFAAIYLIEYGAGSKLAAAIRFLVDVMTGIPSIVAGLFAFSLFTLLFGAAYRSGFGGAAALSLLMVPIVVRSTEEMLRLVPNELREAAYALGTPKWRTIVKVVLPTALGGIVTGVTLAIARVVGETAPLLLIAGLTTKVNWNVFDGFMTTLPVLVYSSQAKGHPEDFDVAWGAAFVLVLIVLVLNIVARIIGKIFAPKTGH